MLVVSLPLLLWFGAKLALQQARNQPVTIGVRPLWLWLALAAVLVVSVLRNLPARPLPSCALEARQPELAHRLPIAYNRTESGPTKGK